MAYLSADERRRGIIDAAIDVIANEGMARATTRRIAERADAPLGALHYCFRGKRELIQVVAERAASTIRTAFEGVDPTEGVEPTIRACVAAFWDWIQENPGLQLACMELLMWAIRNTDEPPDGSLYSHVYDPGGGDLIRQHLTAAAEIEGVALAVEVDELVRFMLHRFDGMVFEYAASGDTAACTRQTELLADALVAIGLPSAPTSPKPKPRRRR